jgi:hypothetical protein
MAVPVPWESLLNIIWLATVFIFLMYGARIQQTISILSIRRSLTRLEQMRRMARSKLISTLARHKPEGYGLEEVVDRLIGSFTITPVNIDPAGLVKKLDHILDTYDEHLRAEVRTIATEAPESEVHTLANLVEISGGLDMMYRIVRHYYLLARERGSIQALAELQMVLPMIMREAEAYHAAMDAFSLGRPVGDGVGPMIASRIASGFEGIELVKDTLVYEVDWEGRQLLVVRAKGPGGNVGKPGFAVQRLVEERAPISLIVTVDAALKLEGEESGEVAEGVGAAIGGPGVERFYVEETATKHGIPLLAVVVKMSSKEAITQLTQQISKGIEEATRRVLRGILDRTRQGDTVIVAGIGNALGIP